MDFQSIVVEFVLDIVIAVANGGSGGVAAGGIYMGVSAGQVVKQPLLLRLPVVQQQRSQLLVRVV